MEDQELITEIYYRVIQISSSFFERARYLTVGALKDVDPTVEELARIMRMLADTLKELGGESWEDEKMAMNAFQCCLTMERLAAVVATGDSEELAGVLRELEINSKVP